jgi:hypothetical protein
LFFTQDLNRGFICDAPQSKSVPGFHIVHLHKT